MTFQRTPPVLWGPCRRQGVGPCRGGGHGGGGPGGHGHLGGSRGDGGGGGGGRPSCCSCWGTRRAGAWGGPPLLPRPLTWA